MPPAYASLLDGIGVAVGPGDPAKPLDTLVGANAVVASALVRYNGELLDQLPTLRVIARTGIGVDNIVIADATARGVAVCNVPDGPTISTSELTLALILATTKQIKRVERDLRLGGEQDHFGQYRGIELYNSRLGLIGLGRIGSRVAKFAQAIGMIVSAYDPLVSPERAAELGVELSPSLEALLASSDVVSLHLPSTPETRRFMNAERLAQMKRGAYLINAARGALVDETAVLHALDSGLLSGFGADVFDPEPPNLDNPLLYREDVVATPHIASATAASRDRLWRGAITQALQALRGERPPNLLNPEVWPLRTS
jgi:D-3-phosphoglycerate dehydrogenase